MMKVESFSRRKNNSNMMELQFFRENRWPIIVIIRKSKPKFCHQNLKSEGRCQNERPSSRSKANGLLDSGQFWPPWPDGRRTILAFSNLQHLRFFYEKYFCNSVEYEIIIYRSKIFFCKLNKCMIIHYKFRYIYLWIYYANLSFPVWIRP